MESLAHSKITTKRNYHNRKKVAEEEIDHFQRLPDELVVQIFEKVSEAKWLCMCHLVSSRFTSLVLQAKTVSFKYTGWRLGKCNLTRDHLPVLSKILNFLAKFLSIRSLHVEVLFVQSREDRVHNRHYEIKWKAMGYRKKFIFLAAKKKRVISRSTHNVGRYSDYKFFSHKTDARMRLLMLYAIIKAFPNLKEAVVTDSLNQGRLSVGEADLDIMRSLKESETVIETRLKLWLQPVLKLPLSRVVMKDAMFLILVKENELDDVSIAENSFEEKELCEAAMEMLKGKAYIDYCG